MDGRRNALVKNQRWEELGYLDVLSFNQYIEAQARGRYTVYGFCGHSTVGNLRIDYRKDTNANLIMEMFQFLDRCREKSIQTFILDPPFVLYDGPGKDYSVWSNAVKKGILPNEIMDSQYFGHPNEWQKRAFELVEPGGIMITQRNMPNTNVLTKNPQMFYVHDSRPSAFIVRVDHA